MKLAKIFGKNRGKMLNILLILGFVVLVGVLLRYSNVKGSSHDNMTGSELSTETEEQAAPAPETGVTPNESSDGQYLAVQGLKSGSKVSTTCNNQPMTDPKELLPNDTNNEWSNIAPNNDLKDIKILNAGHHIGINSVGSSLRNANLQIRSEPVIPQTNVGPWNNTTIEADNLRRPLEIGSTE